MWIVFILVRILIVHTVGDTPSAVFAIRSVISLHQNSPDQAVYSMICFPLLIISPLLPSAYIYPLSVSRVWVLRSGVIRPLIIKNICPDSKSIYIPTYPNNNSIYVPAGFVVAKYADHSCRSHEFCALHSTD